MKQVIKSLLPAPLINLIRSFIKRKKFEEFQKTAVHLTRETLEKEFSAAGLQKGDVLFIHSSLKGLGFIEGGPQTIIEALQHVVGNEGTLVFPSFTMEESMYKTLHDETVVFDPQVSPSTVGKITNIFLDMPGVLRSAHPTHSVAAWGKHAAYITQGHHLALTNFGKGSPFQKVMELHGKIVGIGINYGPVTFYHVYEDLHPELFEGVYLDKKVKKTIRLNDGSLYTGEYLCHAPDFHRQRIDKSNDIEKFFGEYFESKGISHASRIGQGKLWWIESNELTKTLAELYEKKISIYSVNGK